MLLHLPSVHELVPPTLSSRSLYLRTNSSRLPSNIALLQGGTIEMACHARQLCRLGSLHTLHAKVVLLATWRRTGPGCQRDLNYKCDLEGRVPRDQDSVGTVHQRRNRDGQVPASYPIMSPQGVLSIYLSGQARFTRRHRIVYQLANPRKAMLCLLGSIGPAPLRRPGQ